MTQAPEIGAMEEEGSNFQLEDKSQHLQFLLPTILLYFFSFRDPQSLDPPEVSNAKLQYAGWGPKGQQLVSTSSSSTF